MSTQLCSDKLFWQHLYASLDDQAKVTVKVEEPTDAKISSLTKMHGFSNLRVDSDTGIISVEKPVFKSGGTSLKNRKKQAKEQPKSSNPWEDLDQANGSDEINEDDLMKGEDAVEKITAKFGCDSDRIMVGKPCDNCSCGAKEVYEGKITLE